MQSLKHFIKQFFLSSVLLFAICHNVSGQLGGVQQPTFQTFTPVNTTDSYNPNPSNSNQSTYHNDPLEYSRTARQARIEEQNHLIRQKGIIEADEKRKVYEEFLKEEREDEIRKQFQLFREKTKDSKKLQEIAVLKEKFRIANPNSPDYISNARFYFSATQELQQMLEGKITLDLKRAVFITENAWYGNTKSYKTYCNQIDQLVWICREILKQENLSEKNASACHYAIQKLFSDTLTVKKADGSKKTIYPLEYDFDDFWGNDNYSNLFVSKLLNTKSGQCHSLPLLYLILANEFKIPAYLAIAPNHSYVKYPIGRTMYSFECTSDNLISDDWVVASGYISSMAIRTGIYLAPQTPKETIAECLTDLALGYQQKFGYDDYVRESAQLVLKYHPSSISAMLTISNCTTAFCFFEAEQLNFPAIEQIGKYPQFNKRYHLMLDLEKDIEGSGYIKIPQEEYAKWIKTADEESQKRKNKQLNQQMASEIKKDNASSKNETGK